MLGNFLCNLTLDREQILQIAVVFLSPNVGVGLDTRLRGDLEASLLRAALDLVLTIILESAEARTADQMRARLLPADRMLATERLKVDPLARKNN